jgi:SAM-dependent methyltransferase
MNHHAPAPIEFDRVADIYDTYVSVNFDLPFWLQEAGSVRGKVLELACGTGRVSIPLVKAGIDLSCVDYSSGMLDQFRLKLEREGLSCPLYCQDIAELVLPDRFDLIFIPFHSFSEILDRRKHNEALTRIRSHLSAGGKFICTLQNPVVRTASMDGAEHRIGEFPMRSGNTLVVRSMLTFDPETHLASGEQTYEQLTPDGHMVDHRLLALLFSLFGKAEFEDAAAQAGFMTEALYGNYDRRSFEPETSPFMIWKLTSSATT